MLQGLKSRISATLIVLLIVAMFLVNMVVVFFWQRSLLQTKLDDIEAIVDLWCKKNGGLSSTDYFSSKNLTELCRTIGVPCKNVFLFDGKTEHAMHDANKTAVTSLLRKCYSYNKPIKQAGGWTWMGFTFGEKHIYQVLPFNNDIGVRHAIALVLDMESVYKNIRENQSVIIFYVVINAIVLTTIGFFRLAKHLLRPVDKLIVLSESYTNSGELIFSLRKEDNEFGKLSFALNSMLGRINEDKQRLNENIKSLKVANKQLVDSQKKMVRAEKMAAVGRLSAGLAHEVGNPIGIVQGYLELLENDDLTREQRRQFSGRAVKELERINKMVRQLLDFSRTSSEDNVFVSASSVCRDAIGALKSQKVSFGIEFAFDSYTVEDAVGIGYDDLYQVILNCSFNAIDAIQDRGVRFPGKVTISSNLTQFISSQPCLEIKITDNGIGIREEELASVFDPFFTTKDVGKGTGLGLSISCSIVEAAGGVMELESIYGKGTVVVISLPLVSLDKDFKSAKPMICNG